MNDMDNKYRLNSANSQEAVNEDSYGKIELQSKTHILPIGDVEKIINVGDQFNKERQESPYYRLTGTINSLFNNVLFNISEENSWEMFNDDLFRDGTFPPDSVSENDEEDFTYMESIAHHLQETQGWFGYQNPSNVANSVCAFTDMKPGRDLFTLTPKNGIKNWELTITYPAASESINGDITYNGLLIVDSFDTVIGGRNMVTFATPVKHGLIQGEKVNIVGLSSNNGDYTVIRLGKDNGDLKDYYFTVEISDAITLSINPRMKRIFNGEKSIYYFRKFKKIKVKSSQEVMEDDDYEIYPLAFSQNIYEDKIQQFIINEDIDISNLTDNLGRPLSEIYITLMKTSSGGVFTPTKSGIDMPFIERIDSNNGIPDIRRITGDVSSHVPLDGDVIFDDEYFYGDVVEYNRLELSEKVLGEVYDRFNTINREGTASITDADFSGLTVQLGSRQEGYLYKPHHKIKIREYSNYVEQGFSTTLNKPSYAINMMDGRYLWRDLLDIGFNDIQESAVDYPFLNGVHYLNECMSIGLKRQDPFGYYGLLHTANPPDNPGILMDDNIIIKNSQDVC